MKYDQKVYLINMKCKNCSSNSNTSIHIKSMICDFSNNSHLKLKLFKKKKHDTKKESSFKFKPLYLKIESKDILFYLIKIDYHS